MPKGAADSPQQFAALAAVVWDFPLVGRTRMLAEAWTRTSQPAVFVEIPSLRSALQRLTLQRPQAPLPVVRAWPTYPCRYWKGLGEARLRRSIRSRARGLRRQLDRLLDWDNAVATVVSPVWTPWLEELPFGRVVYDCIDDLAVQTPRPELSDLYLRWENELLSRAAGVVVSAEILGDSIRQRRADLPQRLIRNGVDVERFHRQAAAQPRPADLPDGKRPIVGFVGALYEWIDWPLIVDVIRALPQFDFVFVGPHDGRSDVSCVAPLPNARLLGPKPFNEVPAYVQAFDVCWVPFTQDDISRAANPVKMYEYLALGKPVVSTPVADTDSFEGFVTVGRTSQEVTDLLNRAYVECAAGVDARIDFARRNSWDARAAEYVAFAATL